jgi:hypothetical protein
MEQGVFLLFFAVVAVLLLVFHFTRSDSLLHQWAEDNGFRLVRQQYRWVRCGGWFLGLFSDKVEARWDDTTG